MFRKREWSRDGSHSKQLLLNISEATQIVLGVWGYLGIADRIF